MIARSFGPASSAIHDFSSDRGGSMRRFAIVALTAAVIVLNAGVVAAVDSASDLLPVLLDRLTAPLGLPPGPTPPELLQIQEALRVPFIASPEAPTQSFSFRFDPTIGALVPSGTGFGSLYAVRPDTIGRNHFSFGLTYSRVDSREIDGARLTRLNISLGDDLFAKVRAQVLIDALDISAGYGILDNWDVDIAVPILHQFYDVRGSLETPIGPTAARTSRDVTGVGDIVIGTKYRFYTGEVTSFAGRLTVSLPTGEEDDNMGIGTVEVSPSLIGAVQLPGLLQARANIGFRLSGDTDKREHQFFYRAGLEWAPLRVLSASVDFFATHIINNKRPALQETSGVGFPLARSNSNIFDIGLTVKANPWRNLVLTAGVTVPLNSTGLRAVVIPWGGVEMPF
jgi:hypothetical protein